MKKIKFIIVIISILSVLPSCKDVLDRLPDNKIWESDVFEDENLCEKYLINLYARLSRNTLLKRDTWTTPNNMVHYTDLATSTEAPVITNITSGMDRWNYTFIRDINIFIEGIKNADFSEETKLRMEGEARFIRAYEYFEMQKRYGGVPLVDVTLDPFGEIEKKYTQRCKEEELADFIHSELKEIEDMLPADASPKGRVNKWTAIALNARAMLYSASIAKFGDVQLNGLVGIPESRATDLYTKAITAAEQVISSGNYSLYNMHDDKIENYRLIFEDESNSEVIFEEVFDGVKKAHSWDAYCGPLIVNARGSVSNNPTLQLLMSYENIDGSDEQIKIGKDFLYDDGADLFNNRDPRLFATVFLQGDQWAGQTIQTYEGVDISQTPDPSQILSQVGLDYEGMSTVGLDSRIFRPAGATSTGFIVKKYFDSREVKIAENKSLTNMIDIRLAEMYLTKAEAYFELEDYSNAADALNKTRERAGISLVDESSITREIVRNERKVELAFEAHRYWDLRRWRIAESVLNFRDKGVRIIFHHASGKFYFLPMDVGTASRVFLKQHYYQAIGQSRIQNNPDLIENPLYD